MIVQTVCTIGRLFVLAGALWKGKSEFNEMSSLGIRKYFQTTVRSSLELSLEILSFHRVLAY